MLNKKFKALFLLLRNEIFNAYIKSYLSGNPIFYVKVSFYDEDWMVIWKRNKVTYFGQILYTVQIENIFTPNVLYFVRKQTI